MNVGKILAEKFSQESEYRPSTVAASGKVLVPGRQSDSSSSSTNQFEFNETAPENSPVCYIVLHSHDNRLFFWGGWVGGGGRFHAEITFK